MAGKLRLATPFGLLDLPPEYFQLVVQNIASDSDQYDSDMVAAVRDLQTVPRWIDDHHLRSLGLKNKMHAERFLACDHFRGEEYTNLRALWLAGLRRCLSDTDGAHGALQTAQSSTTESSCMCRGEESNSAESWRRRAHRSRRSVCGALPPCRTCR